MNQFQDLGYFKEYWINGKFIGYIQCEKDREVVGYYGAKHETTSELITLQNKKKIKPGTQVKTVLYPLCGKSN